MTTGRLPSIEGGIQPTIVDAKGDLIAATAADTVSRLAVGTNDQVLIADSSTATGLKWGTPASGGMTLISTTTLTGASVTLSSIPQTYKNLQVVVRSYITGTDSAILQMTLNGTTGYQTFSGNSELVAATQTEFDLSNQTDNVFGTKSIFVMHLYDYTSADTGKLLETLAVSQMNSNTSFNCTPNFHFFKGTGAITSMLFKASTGNMTSGTVLLYGVS